MTTQLHDRPPTSPGAPPPPPAPGSRRRVLVALVAAVVVALVALGVAAVVADDDETASTPSATTEPAPPGSTTATTAATTPTTTDGLVSGTDTAVFPPAGIRYENPMAVAIAFADVLGFRDAVVGELQAGDARSGEIAVRPTPDGPVTTLFVRQLGDGGWYVLGAATAAVELTEPVALAEIGSPVEPRGRSTAFEGTVAVEVRQDAEPAVLGTGFVSGGANGEMAPFEGSVAFDEPTSTYGALVLRTVSLEDGSTWEASVVRIRFAAADDAAVPAGTTTVEVFFTVGDPAAPVTAFERRVPGTSAVLRAALEELLAGPTDEERASGAVSWFSDDTAGMLQDVTIDDGDAVVDLGDLRSVIPNASTSAGSAMLLAQLDATVFQFDTVETVVYRIDGDCEAFTEWLQIGGCEPRPRDT